MKTIYILTIFTLSLFAFDPLYTTNATISPIAGCRQIDTNSKITLVDALELALCNDPKTKKAYASIMKSAADVGVSRSAYLPNISASGAQPFFSDPPNQNNLNGSAGLNLSLLVYDFGQTSSAVLNAEKLLESANFTGQSAVQAIFLKTIQDYCLVLATKESVEAAKISENSAYESYLAATAKFNAGTVTVADKLQAQTAWAQSALAAVSANGDYILAKATLASDLAISLEKDLDIALLPSPNTTTVFSAKIKDLIDTAIKQRADLKASFAQVEAAKAIVTQNQSSYMPKITIGGQLGYMDQYLFPPPNNSMLSVNITIPIFSGFSTYYQVRSSKEQVNVKQSDYDLALRDIKLEVYKAYNNFITKTKSLQTTQILLDSAEQSEKVARGRYEAGVGKMIDLLSAQSALQSARQQKIKAELDWRSAKSELAYSMGALSVDEIKNEVIKR
ncbi:MAG: hypothetical protein RL154_1607 [Pseudomonadota bacterium]|jgi:outer membrane protein TolC